MKTLTKLAAIALAGMAAIGVSPAARAQDAYPSRTIKLVVPFPPGGGADVIARMIGDRLKASWDQPVVVENRPGAGAAIGADAVAKAAPDGYTLLMGTVSSNAINASVYKKLPYDPVKDFEPVTLAAAGPIVLVVNPSLPVKSVKDLVDLAKAKPGSLNFASAGTGTSLHLAGEMFKGMAGVAIAHVPYRGSSPALTDLLGGRVQMMFDNMPSSLPHIQAGSLKALAVTTAQRSKQLPDVPTMDEAGVAGYEISAWYGVFAPAGTPKDIVAKLNAEIVKILQVPTVSKHLSEIGAEPVGSTPEQFRDFVTSEVAKWRKVVRDSGMAVE